MTYYSYITDQKALHAACEEIKKSSEVAFDIECENNLHHYGSYISLIQISTRSKNYILDILELKEIHPFLNILENPNIQKVLHDISFDLRILHHQFKCRPKNIFDTQVAALFLGKKELGLGPLLSHYFGMKKESKFQMADWTKRPIRPDMLEYAIKDTVYLLKLKDILKEELVKKGRLSWVEEEFKIIEAHKFEYTEGDYLSMKGVRQLSSSERGILRRLFMLRDEMAMKVNRPTFFIMGNKKMFEIVQNPPKSISEWRNMKGVHPVVRLKAEKFVEAVEKGKKEKVIMETPKKRRYTPEQQDQLRHLADIRDSLSEELSLPKHIVFNKDQMQEIVLHNNKDCLRKWQRVLIDKKLKK